MPGRSGERSRSPTRHLASCRATSRCSSGPGTGPEALISRQTAYPAARASYSDTHSSAAPLAASSRKGHGTASRPLADPERLGREPRAVAVVGGAELDVERVGAELGEQGAGPVRRRRRGSPGDEDPQPGGRAVHPDPEVRVAPGELPHGFAGQALGDARVARSGRGEVGVGSPGIRLVGRGHRGGSRVPGQEAAEEAADALTAAHAGGRGERRPRTGAGTSCADVLEPGHVDVGDEEQVGAQHLAPHPVARDDAEQGSRPASTSSSTGSRSGIRG